MIPESKGKMVSGIVVGEEEMNRPVLRWGDIALVTDGATLDNGLLSATEVISVATGGAI